MDSNDSVVLGTGGNRGLGQETTMKTSRNPQPGLSTTYKDAPTKTVDVGGARFAYRQLGTDTGVPVIFLNHLTGVLDNWDPRVIDGIAARHRVITFDNRGVGASQGSTPDSIEAMARDAVAFIRAASLRSGRSAWIFHGRLRHAGDCAKRTATRAKDHSRGHGSGRRGRHRQSYFSHHE